MNFENCKLIISEAYGQVVVDILRVELFNHKELLSISNYQDAFRLMSKSGTKFTEEEEKFLLNPPRVNPAEAVFTHLEDIFDTVGIGTTQQNVHRIAGLIRRKPAQLLRSNQIDRFSNMAFVRELINDHLDWLGGASRIINGHISKQQVA